MKQWKMSKVFGFSILALGLFVIESTRAADFKLGIIDLQRGLNSVEEGKVQKEKLEKEAKEKKKLIDAQEAKVKALNKEFDDLRRSLGPNPAMVKPEMIEKAQKLEASLRKEASDFTIKYEEYQKDLAQKEAQATQEIIAKLRSVTEEVGRAGQFTMVLEKQSGLVYATEFTDLTERVIQSYNSKFKAKR